MTTSTRLITTEEIAALADFGLGNLLVSQLKELTEQGIIEIHVGILDATKSRWDGCLYVKLKQNLSLAYVINELISYTNSADEITMVDDTITFWWD